jgi:gamma-glutamyltranspeptidase / glutathione hydrolase
MLGKRGFYEGPIAEAIVGIVQERGGDLCLDDLIRHAEIGSEEVDPLSLKFCARDFRAAPGVPIVGEGDGLVDVWECPPNGQGIVALMTLGILQELERSGRLRKFDEEDHNCAE